MVFIRISNKRAFFLFLAILLGPPRKSAKSEKDGSKRQRQHERHMKGRGRGAHPAARILSPVFVNKFITKPPLALVNRTVEREITRVHEFAVRAVLISATRNVVVEPLALVKDHATCEGKHTVARKLPSYDTPRKSIAIGESVKSASIRQAILPLARKGVPIGPDGGGAV